MRRSRFANAVEEGPAPERVGWARALAFDFQTPETENDHQVAAQRIEQLRHVPLLLLTAHLLSILAIVRHFAGRFPADSIASLQWTGSGAVAIDLAAVALLAAGRRWSWTPRLVTLGLASLVALGCGAWAMFAHIVSGLPDEGSAIVLLLIGAGLVTTAVAVIDWPPLAVTAALVGTIAAALFNSDPAVTAGISVLALGLVLFSVATTRSMIDGARQRLHLAQEAHKSLHFVREFEASGRGWFWETNAAGTLTYVSEQLAEDFACEPAQLLGCQFTDLLSVESGGHDVLREERTLGFHLSVRFPFSDVVVRAATGDETHWSLSGNPVFDPSGRFLGFRGIGTDLTEQRRSEQEIARLARFDSLTGLPNRALMRQTLDEALRNAARRQKGCTLFLIDLDRFKNVNDTLGHPVGDKLLREVAGRLTSVIGNHGQIGRLGGDEFKAVLPGTVESGLLESLARTLIEQVSRPYEIEGHRVVIGASVGIAIGDPGRSCADSLVRNADLALYAAKAAGRGKHCFYAPEMHSEASDRRTLENDLRGAIERDELSVCYQPLVRAAGEDVCGFEALVRWSHPTRGMVGPDKFISIAEECGMIGRIGRFVIERALSDATHWPDHVRVAVNLSPIQFNDPDLADSVTAMLREHRFRAERLELEITESVFLGDQSGVEDTVARLKNIGVKLVLDDFGTGYSSLGYLKRAPFDKIKIDQSFVRGAAGAEGRNAAIIRAIVALADGLGMETTAEGVETHDDLHLMRELGIGQVQGYIFGRPVDGEQATRLANAQSVAADGPQSVREPRQRLMRRAIAAIDGERVEVRLRNISATGAQVEAAATVIPGESVTFDIVGVGPVVGIVRWAQAGKFGVQFVEAFDLGRLANRQEPSSTTHVLTNWYEVQQRELSGRRR